MGKDVRIISAGGYDTRGSDVVANVGRDRRFINFFRTIDPETGKRRLEKRTGWTSNGVLTGSSVSYPYGLSVIRNARYGGYGYVFSAAKAFNGTTAVDVIYGTTSLGQISTVTNQLKHFQTEAQLTGGYYHLIAANVGALHGAQVGVGYFYNVTSATATGALTQITDADFPTNGLGPLTQKWGYVFYMDQLGNVYNSDTNSISAWTAGSYFPCNAYPDFGRGVWSASEDLLAGFGSEHIELLYNAGTNTLSPLLRASAGVIEIGAVGASAICETGTGLAFIGRKRRSTAIGVYLLSGTQLQKISNNAIDQYIQTFQDSGTSAISTTMYLTSFQLGGELILLIGLSPDLGTTVKTLACRLSDQFWFEWDYSSSDPIWPFGSIGDKVGGTLALSGGNTTRKTYSLDLSTPAYTDDGQVYTGTLQMTGNDFGTDANKTLNSLTVIGDKAAATDALGVEISDDDAANWVSVGPIDMNTDHRKISSLGPFRKLGVKLTHATATGCRIEAVDVNVSKWGH